MRKPFIIGVTVGIVLVMAASIAITLPFTVPFDEACRDITVYDDISELSFLKPYETEKVDRLLPDGAKESYCANISYKGGSCTVTAFAFDSEDKAMRYMLGLTDENFPALDGGYYTTGCDMAEDTAYVEVTHNGNYYRIDGNCSDAFIEFLQLMFSSMHTPVKGA